MTKFRKTACRLGLLLALCLLTACSGSLPKKTPQLPTGAANATLSTATRQLQIETSISPLEVPPGRIADAVLREKAEKLAMKPLLREFITGGHLFRLSSTPPDDGSGVLFRIFGPTVAQPDPDTDELAQTFHFNAIFSNSLTLAGVVTSFDRGQVVAGDSDVAQVRKMHPHFHPHTPAYALIAQPAENDPTMFRIFGSAKLKQDIGESCQIEILEAHSEVMAGAAVFFVSVRAEAVNRVYVSSKSAGPSSQETITVTPVKEQAAPKQPVIPK